MTRESSAALVRSALGQVGDRGRIEVWIELVTEPSSDLSAVDDIARASFTEGGFSAEEELSRPWARVWLAREVSGSQGRQTVAADKGAEGAGGHGRQGPIVGFLIAWHVADELHVLNVATAPPLRRRGIGRALMNEALAYARSHRVRIVILEVRRSNRAAIRLYRSLGFSALGIRPHYYSDDGEDALEMMAGLDPSTGELLPGRDEVTIEP